MRFRVEYALAWCVMKAIGVLPRPLARAVGIALGQFLYLLHGKLRRVGTRNLAMAFPEKSNGERRRIVRGVFTSLGRQFAEVCLFPRYSPENVSQVVIYDGKGERLFVSVVEAPNRAVAKMMILSQLCRNFATAPLIERIGKLVICQEGTNAGP